MGFQPNLARNGLHHEPRPARKILAALFNTYVFLDSIYMLRMKGEVVGTTYE